MDLEAFGERTVRSIATCSRPTAVPAPRPSPERYVALADACSWLADHAGIANPFGQLVAAVSVGVVDGEPRLDLAYLEDKDAEVDANIVMLHPDRFVEVQGTGEAGTFTRPEFDQLLDLADEGIQELFAIQEAILA